MAQCLQMISVTHGSRYVKNSKGPIVNYVGGTHLVPCGKCAFCLQSRRSSWMFRIHHEMRTQNHLGYFLTLTYDEKHVMRVGSGRLSLRFRDVQLYLKKLRKEKYYAKYICVGEYGGETGRPHYHLLIWTDAPPERIQALWGMGNIYFGKLEMASAMYTLKYIIQPKPPEYEGVEKPRAQFSKGLGLGYLSTRVYYYHTQDEDDPVFTSRIDGKELPLPRYYRNKIFTKHQSREHALKVKLEMAKLYRAEIRELRAKGIRNPRSYVKALRKDEAALILKTTKYGTSL